jgi:hypothetical protein
VRDTESPIVGHDRWVGLAALAGVAYLAIGLVFATLGGAAAPGPMRMTWRLLAWLLSAVVFAAHTGYEVLRRRRRPAATALHVSIAVALGAFALAAAANLHSRAIAGGQHRLLLVALVAWPVLTALPAFLVALAGAAALSAIRRPPVATAVVFAALSLAATGRVRAQEAAPPRASIQLEVDNDVFVVHGSGPPPDYDYTHGTRIGITWPGAPARLARASGADSRCASVATGRPCLLTGLALGQEIYTPRHNAPAPIPGDRPHAAWLYGVAELERLSATTLQALEIRAGVTGPAALGGVAQNEMHRLLHNPPAVGWQAQIPTRVAINADYDATRIVEHRASSAPSRFLAASAGATAGTLRLTLRAAASAYYGFGGAGAWSTASPLVARPGRFHVAAGYERALVVHDTFIEGEGATKGASLIPWVGEAYGAVGSRVGRMEVEYRYVSRSREYRAAPGSHPYAAIVFSLAER